MFQEEAPEVVWDFRDMPPHLSTSSRFYVLFLLIVCIVVGVEIFRAWRIAPPFTLSRQRNNPSYLPKLEASRRKLKQWILCTLLASGTLASFGLYHVCDELLNDRKILGRFALLLALREYATELTMGSLIALFAFLVQWHFFARIQRLRQMSSGQPTPE
jgi:hypothetical protein